MLWSWCDDVNIEMYEVRLDFVDYERGSREESRDVVNDCAFVRGMLWLARSTVPDAGLATEIGVFEHSRRLNVRSDVCLDGFLSEIRTPWRKPG